MVTECNSIGLDSTAISRVLYGTARYVKGAAERCYHLAVVAGRDSMSLITAPRFGFRWLAATIPL